MTVDVDLASLTQSPFLLRGRPSENAKLDKNGHSLIILFLLNSFLFKI